MNEKMKILKLLEEGKITAEEAAKLLSALGEGKKKDVSSRFVESIMDGVSSIVGVIPETIGGVFSFSAGGEKELKVEEGDEFFLKSIGSSIKLSTHNSDEFNIKSGNGVIKTRKEDSTIISKVVGGTAEIEYPSILSVSIKDVGGTIEGSGTRRFSMKQMGGSSKLSFEDIDDVRIESRGGTVTLFLGDCDVSFDIIAPNGSIDFEVPADFTVKKDEKVKGKIKEGKGKLVMKVISGDVSVLPIRGEKERATTLFPPLKKGLGGFKRRKKKNI